MPDTRWLHMGRRSYRQYLVCRDYVYLICLRYEVMFILPRMCGPLSDRESTCHADQFQAHLMRVFLAQCLEILVGTLPRPSFRHQLGFRLDPRHLHPRGRQRIYLSFSVD